MYAALQTRAVRHFICFQFLYILFMANYQGLCYNVCEITLEVSQVRKLNHPLSSPDKGISSSSVSSLPPCSPGVKQGLTEAQVHERMVAGLVNTAVESPTKTEKQIIRDNCLTFFNLVFIVLAACLALVGSFGDMMFLGVAICNTVIGIVQEIRSKRTIDKLTLMTARKVPVIRDGNHDLIPSDQLVRDDIVEFYAGDQICADAVVRQGRIQVNESLITGEADPVTKIPGDALLSGSFLVSGRCHAQLTKVGAESYAAHLTLEAKKDAKASKSEMMLALDKIIHIIGFAMIPLGILLFLQQYRTLELGLQASVQATVAALVGMIPEGLYLLTSIALAVSVMKLAKNNVLTQDMACIESLARVDVLCADKTGTITENVMEAKDPVLLRAADSMDRMRRILSELYHAEEPDNDTGRAMAEKFNWEPEWKASGYIPFTSETKWMAASFGKEGSYLIGAPEFVASIKYPDIADDVDEWTGLGYRVLLLAEYEGIPDPKNLDAHLVRPLCLVPISNRIRPEAKETFEYFRRQGVAIKVISGDNPATVSEVARQAGIEGAEDYVDAASLDTDEKLSAAAERYTVFGRVKPDQKRKLVRALQAAGHTIAMTGDGVNDVLALKDADCGIAMASGAEAACQAAQLVLLDSDFSHMPQVVDEGRRVINNIQRAASLFFVKNIFSFMITLISLFVDMPYPLVPLHLSVISGLTIGIPAFFLALEPNHERVKGKFITNIMLKALPGGLADVFLVLLVEAFVSVFGFDTDQLHTMSAVVMAVIGVRVLYQVSQPMNWKRALVIAGASLALIFSVLVMDPIFDFTMPNIESGLILVVLMMLSFQVMHTVLKLFAKGEQLVIKIRLRDFDSLGFFQNFRWKLKNR